MGIVQRQAFWNIFISYIGIIIGAVNTVLLFPNFFKPEQVGLISLFLNINLLYTQFSSFGSSSLIIRYFPFFNHDKNSKNRFITFAFTIALIGFCVITLVYIFLKPVILSYYDEQADFQNYYFSIIFVSLFTLLFNICESYYWTLLKTIFPSFLKDLLLRVLTGLSILVYAMGWINYHSFINLFLIINSVTGIILFVPLVLRKEIRYKKWKNEQTLPQKKDLIRYSAFTQMNGVSGILVRSIDAIFIASITGLYAAGIYSRSFFIATLLQVPLIGITKIVYPIISEKWKTNSLKEIGAIYREASLNCLIAGCFIFLMIFCNGDQIYGLMPPEYKQGLLVFIILGAARLFDLATGVNGAVIVTSKYYRIDAAINLVFSIITIILNIVLIRAYGIVGAAIGNASAIVLINISRGSYIWWKFKISPFTGKMINVLLLSTVIGFLFYFIPDFANASLVSNLFELFIRISILFSIYLYITYKYKFSPEFNLLIDKVIDNSGIKKIIR